MDSEAFRYSNCNAKPTQHQIAEAIKRRDAGEALTAIGRSYNAVIRRYRGYRNLMDERWKAIWDDAVLRMEARRAIIRDNGKGVWAGALRYVTLAKRGWQQ